MKRFLLPLLLGLAPLAGAPSAAAEKLFAVTITTGPAWDAAKPAAEQAFFKEHSANLARLRAAGLSVIGGRFADKGLLLIRAADAAAVRAELTRDPSITAGVFQATVDEYRPFQHGDTRPPLATPEVAAVRALVAAFNAHDPAGVAALLAEDAKLFGVASDSQSLDGDGRAAILTWLEGYFKSVPDVRSEILDLTQTGPHVSYRERATWTAKDGTRRVQTSLAVYEVREGLVRRAWYFPANREPAAR
ncbi:MAG: nuclear transport factor 2 family protein [Opitutaceae bacterium]|nr:nuclear transport factor 2 family protein [Opitutaceae bacterium]